MLWVCVELLVCLPVICLVAGLLCFGGVGVTCLRLLGCVIWVSHFGFSGV